MSREDGGPITAPADMGRLSRRERFRQVGGNLIYVSQRVDAHPGIGERRDALDGRWHRLLGGAGFRVLPVPNDGDQVRMWLEASPPLGVLLGGGNSPAAYGGAAPERCRTDGFLLDYAVANGVPVLGVCRGMQSIAIHFGGSLKKVDGHVRVRHALDVRAGENVNSYHEYAVDALPEGFAVTASAGDGVIEAIRHKSLPVEGIMWHPEREDVFRGQDIKMILDLFGGG